MRPNTLTTRRALRFPIIFLLFALCPLLFTAAAYADSAASLQFTVAAPDPVMAGSEIMFQTLVVNTGSTAWPRGGYYWVAEVYTIEGEEKKFAAQTEPLSPPETVAPGAAHGVQIPFLVPEMFSGRRLLYRAFLVVDGKRILETDYKGFQVIEREFKPPPEQDVRLGGDISFTYKNSSPDGWSNHQGITSANIVGKVKQSSFLFNTYLVHNYHRPITPNLIFLNYYAPWGTLSLGDVSPSLTPLSMESQGMRGASFERTRDKISYVALVGRIVSPEEPTLVTAGRFSRYTGGFKVSYQYTPDVRISVDSSLSRDDAYSITQDTRTAFILPQQSFVYGAMAEWKVNPKLSYTGDLQSSSYKKDIEEPGSRSGTAWKQELKWKGKTVSARAAYSRVGTKYVSFASPSVIPDRATLDAEAGLPLASWSSMALTYNTYTDNLEDDPAKTTTKQTQTSLSNTSRVFGGTMLTASYMTNAALGKPATVQDNKTTTLSFSVLQPVGVHNLNGSFQTSAFKDNTGFSHDLDTSLISLSGSFKVSPRMSASAGFVNSSTKDKFDSSTAGNNTVNANVAYSMPARAMAFQFWTAMSSGKNDSPTIPSETGTLSLNFETIWLKSRSSKITFGAGMLSRTDKYNPAVEGTDLTLLTRYNYSF
ncbi:MAG: hypothetical protein Q7R35_03830 [Elusimicrobiota bacterium]|nr:hypothetical protein [Elusimicrobiota bacterium]